MKIEQNILIDELLFLTKSALEDAKEFNKLSNDILQYKSNLENWSILECIEHLNLYGNFYLPEIERRITNAETINQKEYFKSSILGNYFARIIKVDNTKKMNTSKEMDVTGSELKSTTIDRFIKQLERLKLLLEKSRKVNLRKVKTSISLTKFIRLPLGDTLRFVVYHNERHIQQAQQIVLKA